MADRPDASAVRRPKGKRAGANIASAPATSRTAGGGLRRAVRTAALVALVVALYARTAGFDFSYLDDDALILDDQAFLSAPGGVLRAFTRPYFPDAAGRDHTYYRPLVTASYAVDAFWGGKDPFGYHLTNVFLHAIATVLLFQLLRRFAHTDNVALFGAVLFAAHPALTEAVAWIPGRNDSLLAVFALASWLLLPHDPPRPAPLRTITHLLAWLAALFTKETALVLPLLWGAQLFWLERRPWRTGGAARLLGGWLAALVAYGAVRASLLTTSGNTGAAAAASLLSGVTLTRTLTNLPSLLAAFGKLAFPIDLAVLAIPEDTALWPAAVAALAVVIAGWKMPGIQRGRLLFGLGCVVILLLPGLPASNLLILENRLYLPAAGMVIALCEIARATPASPRAKTGVALVLVTVLALVSFAYSENFRDRMTFARAAVLQSPHSSLAHRNLGVAYHLAGQTELARLEYQAALVEDASEPVAHNNLGVLLMAKGDLAAAEGEIRHEILLHPRYAPAHHNLAQILDATGRTVEAIPHWESSLAQNEADIAAMRALLAYYAGRDPEKAAHLKGLLRAHGAPTAAP